MIRDAIDGQNKNRNILKSLQLKVTRVAVVQAQMLQPVQATLSMVQAISIHLLRYKVLVIENWKCGHDMSINHEIVRNSFRLVKKAINAHCGTLHKQTAGDVDKSRHKTTQ